jgi:hypothetical protein
LLVFLIAGGKPQAEQPAFASSTETSCCASSSAGVKPPRKLSEPKQPKASLANGGGRIGARQAALPEASPARKDALNAFDNLDGPPNPPREYAGRASL